MSNQLSNISITILYGRAGTGKSTILSTMISRCSKENVSYVVLTATHAALNNIYSIVSSKETVDRSCFKTIYSFFRINYEANVVGGCVSTPKYIFIDEFSLINRHLFKKIIRNISQVAAATMPCEIVNLTICGDALQLNAIYSEKQFISFSKLGKLSTLSQNHMLHPSVAEHLHLSVFGMKQILTNASKRQLTINYRNSSKIMSILSAIYSKNEKFDFPFASDLTEVVAAIIYRGYTFLSSKYKIIQHVYDVMSKMMSDAGKSVTTIKQEITYRKGLKRLYIHPDMELMITATSKIKSAGGDPLYYNGEYVKWTGKFDTNSNMVCLNSDGNEISIVREADTTIQVKPLYYPVIPKQLITIHKAQGQTIDNIIVCIDELFDISMLYTAITRGRNDLIFYTSQPSSERIQTLFSSAMIPEFKQLDYVLSKLNCKNIDTKHSDDDIPV